MIGIAQIQLLHFVLGIPSNTRVNHEVALGLVELLTLLCWS
jgi:hypothetical protein